MSFALGLVVAVLVAFTVPRLLALAIRPGQAYPVYGLRYLLYRMVARLSNIPRFVALFGDSSYVVGYLSRLGYRLRPVVQTGSNFGMAVDHDIPGLCTVGGGTIVSDGLHFGNLDFTNTGFVARRISRSASATSSATPSTCRRERRWRRPATATKVAVPLDGPVRSGVGLLGSPVFEIPLGRGAGGAVPTGFAQSTSPTGWPARTVTTARRWRCIWASTSCSPSSP